MPTRRTVLTLAATLPAVALSARYAGASTPPVYSNDGVAVDASDVVAYFQEGKPVKGSADITYGWKGVEWHFASVANRDTFANDPAAYAPQYGGYCAWAVSEGYTASTIPEAWKIVDGKLYLNFSRRIQRRWERDIPARIAAGDTNWPGVLT
ncbi:YHS domain-containing (seleno)protein [uncultured Tateyamaria sp.]|uniref:YHS domain-containing (seleno)protein n=1 Tax=uncultured Tateyamaria sp. TaxID=455651 RepID=UPI0026048CE9|nr:YHS domain-containing (seleno)protein [uncultured Tateyamaria sp.]